MNRYLKNKSKRHATDDINADSMSDGEGEESYLNEDLESEHESDDNDVSSEEVKVQKQSEMSRYINSMLNDSEEDAIEELEDDLD